MDTALYKLATVLVAAICEHPSIVAGAACVFVLCNLTVNGLRMAYPKQDERPRVVNFLLGFLDIGALNFWRLVQMFGRPDPNPPLTTLRGNG